MSKSTDFRVVESRYSTEYFPYRTPIKFGGRVVTEVTLFHTEVTIESRNGLRAVGKGSMPIGNVWAWPTQALSGEQTTQAMVDFGKSVVGQASQQSLVADPIEWMHQFQSNYASWSSSVCEKLEIAEPMPILAQLVAASPLDAAVHDAFGRLNRANSFDVLSSAFLNHDLAHYLNADFRGEYLDRYTNRTPTPTMPLYHLVGALDPIFDSDVETKLADGLPQSLGEWIRFNGLTHLKIKLNGDNVDWDVERVAKIESATQAAQSARGCSTWFYSLDFNEKCANVEYILEFLRKIDEKSPTAFKRVQYIEQPTHRNLKAHPENKMHAAAKIKPVVIDESLIDFESLLLARELGYSGVALKACKGQTESLLMGAAAQKYGMFLCVQDLTCVGASFLHSASLAARISTIAAIEGNGRQYCPAGNARWESSYPGMFRIESGSVATSELGEVGLGFSWTN